MKPSDSRTYKSWASMIRRCTNPRATFYHAYGGRGINVCDRWRTFENFLADMGECPAGLTIDRIDNNRGYEPGNCQWASQEAQQWNKRTSRRLRFNGETLSVAEWSHRLGITMATIRGRLRMGWPIWRALTAPVDERRRAMHCRNGHALTSDNVYYDRRGGKQRRRCAACRQAVVLGAAQDGETPP